MIHAKRAMKIAALWISAVYVVCYGGVTLFPGIREAFMKYALHTSVDTGANVMTLTTFVTGLVIWNILAMAGAWLFAVVANRVR